MSRDVWRALSETAKFYAIGVIVIFGLFLLFLLAVLVWVLS